MIAWSTEERHGADLERVLDQVLPTHPHVREVTRAVAAALRGEPETPVLASDRAMWTAARALAALGDRASAARVLSETCSLAAWSQAVDLSMLPDATLRLVESGLVQAADSTILGGGLLVRLDMGKLPREETGLELVYVALVHRLVDACAPLWRCAQGAGTLLVFGLDQHAKSLGRGGRSGHRATSWLHEVFTLRLRQWADREGWPQSPSVVRGD